MIPNQVRFERALSLAFEAQGSPRLPKTELNPNARAFLERHKVPQDFQSFLDQYSFAEEVELGSARFGPINELEEINKRYKGCVDQGLLVIGSSLNGDAIVISLKDQGMAGYVNHDRLWEKGEVKLALTPFDLGAFYLASVLYEFDSDDEDYESTTFPCDYDSALERNETGGWEIDFPL